MPYDLASLPPMPNGFSLLIYFLCSPNKKYFVNSGEFERHCNPEFIKHVFPRFYKPTAPLRDEDVNKSLMLAVASESRFD